MSSNLNLYSHFNDIAGFIAKITGFECSHDCRVMAVTEVVGQFYEVGFLFILVIYVAIRDKRDS